jgi:hypothetical protein
MRTETAAANGQRRKWQTACVSRARLLVWLRSPRATIRIRGSFRVVTRDSLSRFWRMLNDEVPRSRSADVPEFPQSGSDHPTEHGPGSGLGYRYLDRKYVRRLADGSLGLYALNLLDCVRWWASIHGAGEVSEQALTQTALPEYLLRVRPTTAAFRFHHQRAHRRGRSRPSQRVSRRSLPDCPRIPSSLPAPRTNGLAQTALGNQPDPCQRTQADHGTAINR